ncbi:hypothetical protein F4778DRAFT_797430 [Xylariomycetidae sp. FL2044]|nr:hypothetical protein F4778DRAFT_797430 [Xylariomycetidae sp. FL2044]
MTEPTTAPVYNYGEPMELVSIKIPSGKVFTEHKQLLCHKSRYFQVIFAGAGGYAETHTGTIELTEHVTDTTMGHFISWIHTGALNANSGSKTPRHGDSNGEPSDHDQSQNSADDPHGWKTLVDVWLLADYLQMPGLQNCVIKTLHGKMIEGNVPYDLTPHVWVHTVSGSALRRFFAAAVVHDPPVGEGKEDAMEELADELKMEILRVLFDRQLGAMTELQNQAETMVASKALKRERVKAFERVEQVLLFEKVDVEDFLVEDQ